MIFLLDRLVDLQFRTRAEWEWPPLEEMRPYDVAWLATEVMCQLHEYTRNGTLDKEYGYFFILLHSEMEIMLDNGTLGYFNGDPPYRPEDDCAQDDSAS